MKSRARIVGDNVSRLRKHQGLTQEELATGLAIHPSYIGLIERGERVPSIRTLESMAEYFGVFQKAGQPPVKPIIVMVKGPACLLISGAHSRLSLSSLTDELNFPYSFFYWVFFAHFHVKKQS